MDTKNIDHDRLRRVFFPYADSKTAAAKASGGRFVYYTTADVAFSILHRQEIWMRNAMAMNDFMEISHGFDCLNAAYKGEAGKVLKGILDSCFPGVSEEVELFFNGWLPHIRSDTYLTCLSEHRADEDLHGRLSMWRAYGGSTGVALVLNGDVMFGTSNAIGAHSSPVLYANASSFADEFMNVVKGIERESDYVKSLGRDFVKNAVFTMLRFAVLCTKHPGFHEELEWRVVASPTIISSPRLISHVEVVRGVPQTVVKLKLENAPSEGLVGLAIPELLNRIIIGPCEFPGVIYRALHQVLREIGVQNVEQKIFISDIPLRHP